MNKAASTKTKWLLLLMAMTSLFASNVWSQATVTKTKTITPLNQTFFNDCSGEMMDLTGEQHQVITRIQKNDGNERFIRATNWANTFMIGQTSGDMYVGQANAHDNWLSVIFGDPYPRESITDVIVRYTHTGGNKDTWILKVHERRIVNADGTVVVNFSNFEIVCQ